MKYEEKIETVLNYHQATKHHFQVYARSKGYMDWENQPQPFRHYEGAEKINLSFVGFKLLFPSSEIISKKSNVQKAEFNAFHLIFCF